MRRSLTCPKCSSGTFWNIRTMMESRQPLAVWRTGETAHGCYETLICESCGYTGWYARGFDFAGLSEITSVERSQPCVECQGPRAWQIPEVRELTLDFYSTATEVKPLALIRKGFPKYWSEGTFSTVVCAGCGQTDWYAHEALVEADPWQGLHAVDATCTRCQHRGAWKVSEVREDEGPLPLTPGRGGFSMVACRKCGYVEWFAHELERLKPVNGRVARVTRPERRQSEGPYR